ncbi:hypothetical protein RYZ20_14755 [Thioclava sp. A2]|uniref:hypothetical protein n=1 Tax=Thioclava sp. FCG-A2 TaxID=3080562 RepID=UPI002954A539|nr:hypothetical protein [Thioclava sp. A2]MDV7272152.1 hypothetical protein [Thioclava sp. A2]
MFKQLFARYLETRQMRVAREMMLTMRDADFAAMGTSRKAFLRDLNAGLQADLAEAITTRQSTVSLGAGLPEAA